MSQPDRVAVVTAASRGIGLGIASALVARGDRVLITGRNPERLAAAVEQLGGAGRAVGVPGKAHYPEHQQAAVARALEEFGRIDYLVNNVGTSPVFGPLVEASIEVVVKILEINLLAALGWTQRVHAAWMAEHGGAVVNVSSAASLGPVPGIGAYGLSKAALNYLTRQLAMELAPGVRVNAVAPAVVKTKFAEMLYAGREEQVAAGYPLGRLGEPSDVAGAVAYLLSDAASWVTGQTIVLDGGGTLVGNLA
ncbi:MAG: glucose 1-dehydrogenase [Micromonosporaceae bacterium]|nr:glucose 1-dehydrogenase [Micromonosporaceae bacterium]